MLQLEVEVGNKTVASMENVKITLYREEEAIDTEAAPPKGVMDKLYSSIVPGKEKEKEAGDYQRKNTRLIVRCRSPSLLHNYGD